nr:helix-turn-helix transcriptional regulator [Paenibacillus xylanexedens]
MKQIGNQIRVLRKKRGLTQDQLGEKVQLPQSYIGGIERGNKNISIETLEKLITALDIHPYEIFESLEVGNSEKENLLDSLKILLSKRDIQEISIIYKLSKEILTALDSKH